MNRTALSKCSPLVILLICSSVWAQDNGAATGAARSGPSGTNGREKWINIAIDQIRRSRPDQSPSSPATASESPPASGALSSVSGNTLAARPAAGPAATHLVAPVPPSATGIASEPVAATSPSPLIPSTKPETMAAAVNSFLTESVRTETSKRAKEAKLLNRVLLASNSSLDAVMILEMIQNRGSAEELVKDIPAAKEEAPAAQASEVTRDPRAQRVVELYQKEDYRGAADEGFPLLSEFPNDNQLRLIVANSLAWSTTRYQDAIDAYRPLLDTPDARDARLGLANVYRWSGREDLALPLYKKVIEQNPDNKDAREGVILTERAMRPRTMISMGTASDSNSMQRQELTLAHRWRTPSGSGIVEIEAGGTNDTQLDLASYQRNITLRYQGLDLPLAPTFDITEQTGPQQNIFGGVNLKLTDDTQLIVNRVNWGLLSFTTAAELANLSAFHTALATSKTGDLGNMRLRVDYFGVSDGNSVVIGNLQYTPSWRPLGEYFKPFVGISTRDQSNYSPLYWSPINGGYGVYFVGMQAEWSNTASSLFASAQVGNGLYGEGGFNWGVSLGGRTWLNDDYAIGAKLNKYAGGQYGPSYSFTSALVTLERAW